MNNCYKCRNYQKTYDELGQSGEDIAKETYHYCTMWTDHIPKPIENDKKICEFFVERVNNG